MDAASAIGKGMAFPPRVGPDGRLTWSSGSANVAEGIQIILLTQIAERIMLADFGSRLQAYLYEPNTAATRRLIRQEIESSLNRWEPRIELQSVVVEQDATDARSAVATIYYKLIATQVTGQASLKVNLAQ